jgi:tetratricopeptide (TPR) repeat protein
VFSYIVVTLLALYLGGRAAIIGFTVATFYLWHHHYPSSLLKKKWLLVVATVALFFILFFAKPASSNGRLLIYKVTFSQLSFPDYVWGLGLGKFKAYYNLLQANYFTTHNITSKESLLADHSYYLFNDWLQMALELGIIGFVLLGAIIFLFFQIYHLAPDTKKKSSLLICANAGLLSIAIAALFSYPLQHPVTLFLFMIYFTIHSYFTYSLKPTYQSIFFKRFTQSIILISTGILAYYSIKVYQYKQLSKQAMELTSSGYKNKALTIYSELKEYPFQDYNALYNEALVWYQKKDLRKALQVLNDCEKMNIDDNIVKLKAEIHTEQDNYTEAEKNYLLAVYMIPNRMQSKYNLMQFYKQTNQLSKASYWANAILTMPIKVPSVTTEQLLRNTKLILQEIEHFNTKN